jgi:phospholipase/lecithinase/hemolysin
MQTLYFAGARNFVIANIPQVGCAPGIRNFTANGVCEPTANAASQQLSLGYETLTQGLQTALPNATFVLFDAFNATAAAVAYPTAFGTLLFLYSFVVFLFQVVETNSCSH